MVPSPFSMGTINDRLDFDLLHATAEAGGSLLLVGPPSPTPSTTFPQAPSTRW